MRLYITAVLNSQNVVYNVSSSNHTPNQYWQVEDRPQGEVFITVCMTDHQSGITEYKEQDQQQQKGGFHIICTGIFIWMKVKL